MGCGVSPKCTPPPPAPISSSTDYLFGSRVITFGWPDRDLRSQEINVMWTLLNERGQQLNWVQTHSKQAAVRTKRASHPQQSPAKDDGEPKHRKHQKQHATLEEEWIYAVQNTRRIVESSAMLSNSDELFCFCVCACVFLISWGWVCKQIKLIFVWWGG